MRNVFRIVAASLLALILAACGGSAAEPDPRESSGPSKESAEPTSEVKDAAFSWGHLAFTGKPSDYLVIEDSEQLAEIVDPSAIPGDAFEPYAVIMPADGSTSTVAIVLRSKEGTQVDEALIENVFMGLTGNDLRATRSLSDGSSFSITYIPNGSGMSVATADEADGTLWVSAFRVADINAFLPLFTLDGTTPLRELVVDGETAGVMRVGSAETGYVDVPDTWAPFTDTEFPDLLQYSDPSGKNIITFNSYTLAELELEGSTMDEAAQMLASSMLWSNDEDEAVENSEGYVDTVGGIDCYLVVAEYTDGSELDIFCIPGEERVIYISVEGNPDDVLEQGMRVRDSFSMEG